MGRAMQDKDIVQLAQRIWDKRAREGYINCVPALHLTREMVKEFVTGERDDLPGSAVDPRERPVFQGVERKQVLCLASGGGQQSAVFGLLGAKVTVFDLCEGQLEADRVAARHYGYEVRTVKGDMRDLSVFDDATFDLVYQAISICWVPDVRPVDREVHRVLRPGGIYSVAHLNPATYPFCFEGGRAGWDGTGYRLADRYKGGPILRNAAGVENMEEGEPIGEHRHLLRDIFGGLLEAGFIIRDVGESPHHLKEPITGEPGSHEHSLHFIAEYFGILAQTG